MKFQIEVVHSENWFGSTTHVTVCLKYFDSNNNIQTLVKSTKIDRGDFFQWRTNVRSSNPSWKNFAEHNECLSFEKNCTSSRVAKLVAIETTCLQTYVKTSTLDAMDMKRDQNGNIILMHKFKFCINYEHKIDHTNHKNFVIVSLQFVDSNELTPVLAEATMNTKQFSDWQNDIRLKDPNPKWNQFGKYGKHCDFIMHGTSKPEAKLAALIATSLNGCSINRIFGTPSDKQRQSVISRKKLLVIIRNDNYYLGYCHAKTKQYKEQRIENSEFDLLQLSKSKIEDVWLTPELQKQLCELNTSYGGKFCIDAAIDYSKLNDTLSIKNDQHHNVICRDYIKFRIDIIHGVSLLNYTNTAYIRLRYFDFDDRARILADTTMDRDKFFEWRSRVRSENPQWIRFAENDEHVDFVKSYTTTNPADCFTTALQSTQLQASVDISQLDEVAIVKRKDDPTISINNDVKFRMDIKHKEDTLGYTINATIRLRYFDADDRLHLLAETTLKRDQFFQWRRDIRLQNPEWNEDYRYQIKRMPLEASEKQSIKTGSYIIFEYSNNKWFFHYKDKYGQCQKKQVIGQQEQIISNAARLDTFSLITVTDSGFVNLLKHIVQVQSDICMRAKFGESDEHYEFYKNSTSVHMAKLAALEATLLNGCSVIRVNEKANDKQKQCVIEGKSLLVVIKRSDYYLGFFEAAKKSYKEKLIENVQLIQQLKQIQVGNTIFNSEIRNKLYELNAAYGGKFCVGSPVQTSELAIMGMKLDGKGSIILKPDTNSVHRENNILYDGFCIRTIMDDKLSDKHRVSVTSGASLLVIQKGHDQLLGFHDAHNNKYKQKSIQNTEIGKMLAESKINVGEAIANPDLRTGLLNLNTLYGGKISWQFSNAQGENLLHVAARNEDPQALLEMLDNGADPTITSTDNKNQHFPLHNAIEAGNFEIAKILIKIGYYPVRFVSQENRSVAVELHQDIIIKLLSSNLANCVPQIQENIRIRQDIKQLPEQIRAYLKNYPTLALNMGFAVGQSLPELSQCIFAEIQSSNFNTLKHKEGLIPNDQEKQHGKQMLQQLLQWSTSNSLDNQSIDNFVQYYDQLDYWYKARPSSSVEQQVSPPASKPAKVDDGMIIRIKDQANNISTYSNAIKDHAKTVHISQIKSEIKEKANVISPLYEKRDSLLEEDEDGKAASTKQELKLLNREIKSKEQEINELKDRISNIDEKEEAYRVLFEQQQEFQIRLGYYDSARQTCTTLLSGIQLAEKIIGLAMEGEAQKTALKFTNAVSGSIKMAQAIVNVGQTIDAAVKAFSTMSNIGSSFKLMSVVSKITSIVGVIGAVSDLISLGFDLLGPPNVDPTMKALSDISMQLSNMHTDMNKGFDRIEEILRHINSKVKEAITLQEESYRATMNYIKKTTQQVMTTVVWSHDEIIHRLDIVNNGLKSDLGYLRKILMVNVMEDIDQIDTAIFTSQREQYSNKDHQLQNDFDNLKDYRNTLQSCIKNKLLPLGTKSFDDIISYMERKLKGSSAISDINEVARSAIKDNFSECYAYYGIHAGAENRVRYSQDYEKNAEKMFFSVPYATKVMTNYLWVLKHYSKFIEAKDLNNLLQDIERYVENVVSDARHFMLDMTKDESFFEFLLDEYQASVHNFFAKVKTVILQQEIIKYNFSSSIKQNNEAFINLMFSSRPALQYTDLDLTTIAGEIESTDKVKYLNSFHNFFFNKNKSFCYRKLYYCIILAHALGLHTIKLKIDDSVTVKKKIVWIYFVKDDQLPIMRQTWENQNLSDVQLCINGERIIHLINQTDQENNHQQVEWIRAWHNRILENTSMEIDAIQRNVYQLMLFLHLAGYSDSVQRSLLISMWGRKQIKSYMSEADKHLHSADLKDLGTVLPIISFEHYTDHLIKHIGNQLKTAAKDQLQSMRNSFSKYTLSHFDRIMNEVRYARAHIRLYLRDELARPSREEEDRANEQESKFLASLVKHITGKGYAFKLQRYSDTMMSIILKNQNELQEADSNVTLTLSKIAEALRNDICNCGDHRLQANLADQSNNYTLSITTEQVESMNKIASVLRQAIINHLSVPDVSSYDLLSQASYSYASFFKADEMQSNVKTPEVKVAEVECHVM